MRTGVIAAAVAATVAVVAAYGQPKPSKLPKTPIDAVRLSHDVRVLSSDAYQGRSVGAGGEAKAVGYLIKRFKALGLKPGGEHGSWTQPVPLVRYSVQAPVALTLTDGTWSRPLVQGRDAVAATLQPVDRVAIQSAPLVFIGYGVNAPERNWDDFKGVDLHGKIAVVLINDPDFENPLSRTFDGRAETWYGRWRYKYEEAARRGALGVLIVHEAPAAGYGWSTVAATFAGPQYELDRSAAGARPLLQGWLQRDVAVELFRKAGLDFDAVKRKAQDADFQPVVLQGATLSADYRVRRDRVVSRNVLAKLPGAERPRETVIYSAHWDHFGRASHPEGDPTYYGAPDDGTGLAALLELARVYVHAPPTGRTVVFAAFTAEERGQLGAEYYASRPVYPLETTVADINLEGLQTAGPAHDLVLPGAGKDTLGDDLGRAAARQGRRVTPEAHPEAGDFYRGDQMAFARRGVPVLTLTAAAGAPNLVKGGRKAGEAWLRDYMATRMSSTPKADGWRPDWDLRGAALDLSLVYDLGRDLANSTAWPRWKSGAEFAAVRPARAGAPGRASGF
jgi:Zn-dependent M28 family amino/carboxypeptidase